MASGQILFTESSGQLGMTALKVSDFLKNFFSVDMICWRKLSGVPSKVGIYIYYRNKRRSEAQGTT